MNIGQLKEIIKDMDNSKEVFIRTNTICGNIADLEIVEESSYGFFGKDIPCVILDIKK